MAYTMKKADRGVKSSKEEKRKWNTNSREKGRQTTHETLVSKNEIKK